jgi:CGNR zinc finger
VNPTAVIALANLQRRRRWDTTPRAPLLDVPRALSALAEEGLSVDGLTEKDLPALARLTGAVSELGDCLALRRAPALEAVGIINELASRCAGTARLSVTEHAVRGDVAWLDPDPVAGLARRIIHELVQCQRHECDLLFFDPTRSRSQRWHAENPCGWLERQRRKRALE